MPRYHLLTISVLALAALAPGCKSSVRVLEGGSRSAAEPEALEVTAIEPAPGRAEVGPRSVFRVTFSAPVDPASLGDAPLVGTSLVTLSSVEGTSALEPGGKSIVFRPARSLQAGSMYSLDVSPGLKSVAGGRLEPGREPGSPQLPAYYATFSEPPVLRGVLTLAEATSSSLELAWGAASDNASPDGGEIVYRIYLARTPAPIDFGATPEKETAPGRTTDVVTRLEPGVDYRVAIRAMDPAGNLSSPSNEIAASTMPVEDREPPVFGGVARLEADPALPTSLRAFWEPGEDRPDPGAPLRYSAYVALESGQQDFRIPAKVSDPGAAEMEIEGLSPDTEYFVVVRALDAAGNEDSNTLEAPPPRTTPVSFRENVFKVTNLPAGYDASVCWPPCTNPAPGGCSKLRCHVGRSPAGGVNLSTFDGFLAKKGNVVPGDPSHSLLIVRMRAAGSLRMPQDGTCNLSSDCIDQVARWIAQGAVNN